MVLIFFNPIPKDKFKSFQNNFFFKVSICIMKNHAKFYNLKIKDLEKIGFLFQNLATKSIYKLVWIMKSLCQCISWGFSIFKHISDSNSLFCSRIITAITKRTVQQLKKLILLISTISIITNSPSFVWGPVCGLVASQQIHFASPQSHFTHTVGKLAKCSLISQPLYTVYEILNDFINIIILERYAWFFLVEYNIQPQKIKFFSVFVLVPSKWSKKSCNLPPHHVCRVSN